MENSRDFLKSCSEKWIGIVNKHNPKETEALTKKHINDKKEMSEALLDYFAKVVPAKPRKLKRVSKLFEAKLVLIGEDKSVNLTLLARVTLLELFAPKLLRFMLSHDKYYGALFSRLEEFRNCSKEKLNSLEDMSTILSYIEKLDTLDKHKKMNKKLIGYVEEHYVSRVKFELDDVFEGLGGKESSFSRDLKSIVELHDFAHVDVKEAASRVDSKDVSTDARKPKKIISDDFMKLLFFKDELSWQDAFKEDSDFGNNQVRLTNGEFSKIREKSKKEKLDKNAKWITIVAKHCTIEQVESLLYFELEKTTVTFDDYDEYCESKGIKKPEDKGWGRKKRPVINVSWDDTQKHIEWKNENGDIKYRLPKRDEWELACNLGRDTTWHFGDDEKELENYAWYSKNSDEKTHKVGELKENDLELKDMHGNVWEWCEDFYDEDKDTKVLKSGSWFSLANDTQTSYAFGNDPHLSNSAVGFRLLRTLH